MKAKSMLWVYISFFCFCTLGVVLFHLNKRWTESLTPNNSYIYLDEEKVFQKMIGNDSFIEEMFIPLEIDAESDFFIDVSLTEGYAPLYRNVLFEGTYSSSSIKNNKGITIKSHPIKLKFDRDYYISFSKQGEDGKARIPCIDVEFVSLYKGDNDFSQSIVYSAKFFRKNVLFGIWFFLFISMGITFGISVLLKQTVFRSLGHTILLLSVILYTMGLSDNVNYAVPVCFCIASFAWAVALLKFNKSVFQDLFLHAGKDIAIYALIMLIFAIHDSRFIIYEWDECSHWATAVKNMYMYDSMYIHSQSTVVCLRYPPLYTLFQYWMIKVAGFYNDGLIHFAKHFLEVSLLLYSFDRMKFTRTSLLSYLFLICAVLGLPDIIMGARGGNLFNSVYADITLGCVFAAFLVSSVDAIEHPSIIVYTEVFILTLALILVKDNGMILWVASFSAASVATIVKSKVYKEQMFERKKLVVAAVSFFAFAFARISWELYVSGHTHGIDVGYIQQIDTGKTIGISAKGLLDFLTFKADPKKYIIIIKHLYYLFFECCYQQFPAKYSFVTGLVFLICMIGLAYKSGYLSKTYKLQGHFFVLTSAVCTYAIYTIVYVFTMSDGIDLPSFPRYYGSLLIGLVVWEVVFLFNNTVVMLDQKAQSCIMKSFIICILVFSCFFSHIWQPILKPIKISQSRAIRIRSRAIGLRKNLKESDKVFYISSGDTGGLRMLYMYYASPIRFNPRIMNDDNGDLYSGYIPRVSEPKKYEYQLSKDDFVSELDKYQYIAIDKHDNVFSTDYGFAFDDDIEDGWLYKPSSSEFGTKLKKYCKYF